MATVEKLLRLNREKHRDFNLTHLVEKLHSEEGIELSYSWAISHLLPDDAYLSVTAGIRGGRSRNMETVTEETKEAIPSIDFERMASTSQPSLVQELWDFLRYNKNVVAHAHYSGSAAGGLAGAAESVGRGALCLHALLARTVADSAGNSPTGFGPA